ncbi:MAG: hypothetical protein ACRDJY_03585, partial [Thermoleophilaceae bacterium]
MSYWDGTKWVADTPPVPKSASRMKRIAAATLEASLVTALTFGLIAGSVFAAKGGNRGGGSGGGGTSYSGSLWLAPLVVDNNGNGAPNRGDVVTFNISTNNPAPFVQLECFQGGSLVLLGRKGYFEGSLDTNWNFGLSSGVWQSGAAECTGSLVYYTKRGWSKYASTSFHVD